MTRITDLIGIKYPIFQGGMAWVADWHIAAAVSEAGGLGIIGVGGADENWLRDQIKKCREATDKPFGVNLMLIMALGTSPNPLIGSTTRNLDLNRKGCIVADEVGATSRPGIFAGGDAVSGAATVILAMGAGKKAAKAIDEYIKSL